MIRNYVVTPCIDYKLVKEICLDPDILHRLSDDFFDIETYKPENDGAWLRCDRNNTCVGIVRMTVISPLDLRIHINIPKKHRTSCLHIGRAFIDFVEQRKGNYVKLSTCVGEQYTTVIRFAEKIGFTNDGLDRMSYKRDGKIYDSIIMSYIFK